MYIAGTGPVSVQDSNSKISGSVGIGASSWHKGPMSKRFDGKDESYHTIPKPLTVCFFVGFSMFRHVFLSSGSSEVGNCQGR